MPTALPLETATPVRFDPSMEFIAPDEADEAMAFSPWHGLEAHRPIGSIMRARKPAYEMSAQFRATASGMTIRREGIPL